MKLMFLKPSYYLPWNRLKVVPGQLWVSRRTGRYWRIQDISENGEILGKCLFDMSVKTLSRFDLWFRYNKSKYSYPKE